MQNNRDIRFFPIFIGATLGVVLEIIATLVDEVVVGNLFSDEAFASINLIEPYIYFQVFIAYLVSTSAAFIVRARGAGDKKKMSELFSQTLIVSAICGVVLTAIYVLFTPQLVRLVANDLSVYKEAYSYFSAMRFYPLLDICDVFMFSYVLYRGGFVHFYTAIIARIGANAFLSWFLASHIGVAGIGWASILSVIIALAIKFTFVFSNKHGLKFRWHLNLREVFEIAKIGFPESALSIFIVMMEIGINTFTLKTYSAAGVAAVAVVINVFELALYMSEGISEFENVAVNDSIGKRSSRSMDRAIKITKRAALIEGGIMTILIVLAANVLPSAFDIDDPDTASLATKLLFILAPTAVFICLTRITAIFYQYTRRIKRTLFLFGVAVAVFPVSLAMLLGQMSIYGIAVGIAAGPMLAMIIMYLFVRFVKKEKLFDYSLLKLD